MAGVRIRLRDLSVGRLLQQFFNMTRGLHLFARLGQLPLLVLYLDLRHLRHLTVSPIQLVQLPRRALFESLIRSLRLAP
jgi:hypothetical protein